MSCTSISVRHLAAACALASLNASALAAPATYYVSSSSGNDSYDGTKPTHPWLSNSGPWKTLDKVNRTVQPGDTVYLTKGDVWEETLIPKSQVTYDSYGATGDKPLIRGSRYVGGLNWSRMTGTMPIYAANVSSLNAAAIGQLYINGSRLTRARFPNVGDGAYNNAPTLTNSRYLKVAPGTPGTTTDLKVGINTAHLPSGDLVGATVFVRNNNFVLSQYQVGNFDGQTMSGLTTSSPGNYPIETGWGYWLENKYWMLDSAGEWFYDTTSKTLYVWMLNGATPSGQALYASVQESGIAATGVNNVKINNIQIAETRGDGIKLVNATDTKLTYLDVNRAGARGISLSSQSNNNAIITNRGTLDHLQVKDSVSEGIWMGDFRFGTGSANIDLTNSLVSHAGFGYYANSAIMMGKGGTAANNVIDGASYIGLFAWRDSIINGNFIYNTCAQFSDCAGIYAIGRGELNAGQAYPLNLSISNNQIVGASGSLDGRADNSSVSATGIYLDDYARLATVTGNFVTGADVGVLLHFARDITVSGNTTFNNRAAEVWMQENTDTFDCTNIPTNEVCNASNFLMRNHINNNTLVSTSDSPVIWMASNYDSTSDFADFGYNTYAHLKSRDIIRDEYQGSVLPNKTLDLWKASSGQDQTSTVFGVVPTVSVVTGVMPLVNGTFDGQDRWDTSNADGKVSPDNGLDGKYMYVDTLTSAATNGVTGRKVSVLSSPARFSTVANQAYLLTFDAKSTVEGDIVYGMVSNPSDNFRQVSTRGTVKLSTAWQHFRMLIVANSTLNNAARLDLEIGAIAPINGVTSKLSFDNINLVPATSTSGNDAAFALYNTTNASTTYSCPASVPSRCTEYVDLRTLAPVTFPVSVAAKSSKILVWAQNPSRDTDNDGVPNSQDQCANTAVNTGVDTRGCVVGQ